MHEYLPLVLDVANKIICSSGFVSSHEKLMCELEFLDMRLILHVNYVPNYTVETLYRLERANIWYYDFRVERHAHSLALCTKEICVAEQPVAQWRHASNNGADYASYMSSKNDGSLATDLTTLVVGL